MTATRKKNLLERKHTYSKAHLLKYTWSKTHIKGVIQMTAMQVLLKAVLWCLCVSEWTITSHSLCSNARHDSRTPLNPVKPLDPRTPGIESYCADRHINRPGNSRWLAAVRMGTMGEYFILRASYFLLSHLRGLCITSNYISKPKTYSVLSK